MKKFLSFMAFVAIMTSASACCCNSSNTGKKADEATAVVADVAGKWNIVKVNGEAVSVVADAEKPFLEFNTEESKLHGFSGVNIMNGSYVLDEQTLTFGNIATTMMAGPQENMAVEGAVLGALAKVAKVSAVEGGLQLLDAEGNVVVELAK